MSGSNDKWGLSEWISFVGMVLLLVLSVTGIVIIRHGFSGMEQTVADKVREMIDLSTLTTRWEDKQCVEHSITTTQLPGESTADFIARHKAAVDAAQAAWPPKN